MRRVFFHIGAPKTGTSYLQDLLYRNRRLLKRHGILYPSLYAGDQFRAMLDLRGIAWHGYRDPWVPGSWNRIAHRSRTWPGTVVLSQESLAAATGQQALRARESVQPAEVHIVYTVRDLGRLMASAWQQSIRGGGRRGFADYVEHLAHAKQGGSRGFWQHHDVPKVLRRWSRGLPAEHVHILPLTVGDSPAQLWERFASLLNIQPGLVTASTKLRHVSLGYTEAELLRRVNDRLDGRLKYPLYGDIVTRWLAEDLLTRTRSSASYALPAKSYPWIRALAEHYIDVLRSEGYSVLGDIESLLPAQPSEAQPAQSPASTEEQLDSGLEVIAELLLAEARERQRPITTFLQHTARAVRRSHPASRWLADAAARLT